MKRALQIIVGLTLMIFGGIAINAIFSSQAGATTPANNCDIDMSQTWGSWTWDQTRFSVPDGCNLRIGVGAFHMPVSTSDPRFFNTPQPVVAWTEGSFGGGSHIVSPTPTGISGGPCQLDVIVNGVVRTAKFVENCGYPPTVTPPAPPTPPTPPVDVCHPGSNASEAHRYAAGCHPNVPPDVPDFPTDDCPPPPPPCPPPPPPC